MIPVWLRSFGRHIDIGLSDSHRYARYILGDPRIGLHFLRIGRMTIILTPKE